MTPAAVAAVLFSAFAAFVYLLAASFVAGVDGE